MADLLITAANVASGASPATGQNQTATALAGVAITAGESIYLDTSGLVQLAKGDSATHAKVRGVALNNAAAGQPVVYQYGGQITIGATVVQGGVYVVSAANGGGIAPIADLTTGNLVSIVGIADTTTTLQLTLNATGIAHG